MKFVCFSEVTFFKQKTELSYIPTTIEKDVWLIPVVMLYGENRIGKGAFIQNSSLVNTIVGKDCAIDRCDIIRSSIENNADVIGASIFDSEIDERVIIGRGVSIDNAKIGANVHMPHSCNVAHCLIGEKTLISSHACINNYSSRNSELIDIGEKCFIGPNVSISGSCLIGNEVYIGDGVVMPRFIEIPDHTWIVDSQRASPNSSFYLNNGLWVITPKPTEPKLMQEITEALSLYDSTVAFSSRLKNDLSYEWLVSPHPRLNEFRPFDLLKEDALYENLTGAIALKKLLDQEIESLPLDSSSLPS